MSAFPLSLSQDSFQESRLFSLFLWLQDIKTFFFKIKKSCKFYSEWHSTVNHTIVLYQFSLDLKASWRGKRQVSAGLAPLCKTTRIHWTGAEGLYLSRSPARCQKTDLNQTILTEKVSHTGKAKTFIMHRCALMT